MKIMPLRIGWSGRYWFYEVGYVRMDFIAEALYYAADNGADIASCSWGSSNTGGLAAAINYFLGSGGIIIKAAGNDGSQTADYMCGLDSVSIVSVAATDTNDCKADFSTYGTWVDISAPGTDILSTFHDHNDPQNDYVAAIDGTSMSAPLTAGVAALIWSKQPTWDRYQVIQQLFDSADDIYGLSCNSSYYNKLGAGRINAYNAVNLGTPPPVADFSGSPTEGCVPLTVNFTDLSTGDITSWDWDFGDGGSSTMQNPVYEYTSGGTFTVSLTVTGPGGSDGETKTNYITVKVGPTAEFYGTPTAGTEPLTVSFYDQSSGATLWSWDFGDGGTSTAQNPTHEYSQGTYTVSLTVTNECGSDVETKTDYIVVEPCLPPVADFEGTPLSGEVPLTVSFTDLSTNDPTGWDWDFGEGGSSTQQNPVYEYTSAGTYTVTLTATNSCGPDVETKTDYITVTCTPPTADFAGDPTSGGHPLTVQFTDQSSGATSWDWDFGDTQTSTEQNPSHQYSSPGVYTVTLTVTNDCGSDIETKNDYITVYETPVAAFSGTPTSGCVPLTVNFTDESTGDITGWSWNFGDGGSSTAQNPSHEYTSGGTYTVSLTVTGPGGSDDEIKTDYITVNVAPTADFAGSPRSGDKPLTVTFTDQSSGNPTSWDWDFGDGGSSTLQNPSYEYTEAGFYAVTLTATNACGSDIESKTDYIEVKEPSQNAMHVHNIEVTRQSFWRYSRGIATVTIYDQGGSPVSSATVYGNFSGPLSQSTNGNTNSSGQVTFYSNWTRASGEWCFEVTDVVKTGWIYDSGANLVTKACESGPVYSHGPIFARSGHGMPESYRLFQNNPNPFNPTTTISYELPVGCHVNIAVYNIRGQEVKILVNGWQDAGVHQTVFIADGMASGIYFYRITTDQFVESKKMLLVK